MEKRFELFEIVIEALNEKNTLDNLILIGGWCQYFYRTRSGLEIDLLLQTFDGYYGCEIKSREKIVKSDTTALKKIAGALGKEWLGGMIIYRGKRIQRLEDNIWAIPSYRLLNEVSL